MSKLFSTILLSMILLMLVVGVVNGDANVNLPTPGENEDAGKRSAPGAMPSHGEDDDPGIGSEGPVETPDTPAGEEAAPQGEESSREGTPPSGPVPDIPEFSTIGMLAAGAAAGLGYLYMRKRRK